MEGLLDGIVVLDLGRVLACPYAATMMADMGATVIKIENPKGGDDTRKMGPFVNGNSVYYANFNRGKVGVTLNLKEPEGKEIFKEMVKKADVVLENYRPGTMEKLGLGYDVLKEVNPGIIYGSISGFGHTGPLSKRAGYDIVGQAMGGLMSTTGWPDGPATRTGTPMGDVLGALNMTVGVLAALVNKQRTGKGEKVDVALVDSVAAAMENITMIYQSTGRIPQRIGNRYESTYPYDTFPAKDGDVVIAAGNNKLYAILCDVMGKPELKTDPRFAEVKDRVANHVAMREIIVPWTKQHTIDEVDKLLNDAGCPACPVNTLDRLVVDPQIAGARGMFPTIDQPGIGELQITAIPAHTTRTSTAPRKAAPLLGEDNANVYGKLLGLDEAKLADLQAVDAVEKLIDAIGTVTLDSEEAIKAARDGYDALTEEQKELVGNYQTLLDAEAKLAQLKKERKSTRLNSSHQKLYRMPASA